MTMLRPMSTAHIVTRAIDSAGVKAVLTAVLTATAWHYTDAGDIKSLKQQNRDQGSSLAFQRGELERKIDRDAYEADRKEIHDDLRDIRLSQEQIKQILMERRR